MSKTGMDDYGEKSSRRGHRRDKSLAELEAEGQSRLFEEPRDPVAVREQLASMKPVEGNRDTSKAAAIIAYTTSASVLAQILLHLRSASRGGTSDELEQVFDRPHTTISARLNDLMNAGLIEESGEYPRRATRYGSPAIVWVLTVRGYEVASALARGDRVAWKKTEEP